MRADNVDLCDFFKSLENIQSPDIRGFYQVRDEQEYLKYLHAQISLLGLSCKVPEDVFIEFEVCKNTLLYSYYSYRMSGPCVIYTFSVLELAIGKAASLRGYKFKKNDGLRAKMKYAFNEGLWDIRELAPRTAAPKDWNEYTFKAFLEYYVFLRNDFAHKPNALFMTMEVVDLLKVVCKMINKLFDNTISDKKI